MIRVLVVDDSRYARQSLRHIIENDDRLTVVGEAMDALQARDLIKQLDPDVVTLDVEMPGMDGIKFLENLIRLRPTPVVMVSSLTQRGADATFRALEIGAVDYVAKPNGADGSNLEAFASQIVDKVVAASMVSPGLLASKSAKLRQDFAERKHTAPSTTEVDIRREAFHGLVVGVGASTGGPEALRDLISQLPGAFPPVLISLHIQPGFSTSLANRLNSVSQLEVREAEDGLPIEPGCAYLAPGDHHLELVQIGFKPILRVQQEPKVNMHRPSVDVMFDSIARYGITDKALGIIMTGMGKDGAQGLLRMRQAGMTTFAQDEASSVVWGMPGEAHKIGAATETLPLDRLAGKAVDWAQKRARSVPMGRRATK